MRDDTPAVPVGQAKQTGIPGLDMTTFSQLIMAIQQAGLSLNVNAIHSVCDREFRDGRYQRAFDVIEGVYLQMNAQVGRRQAELRQQELQYKSGALEDVAERMDAPSTPRDRADAEDRASPPALRPDSRRAKRPACVAGGRDAAAEAGNATPGRPNSQGVTATAYRSPVVIPLRTPVRKNAS